MRGGGGKRGAQKKRCVCVVQECKTLLQKGALKRWRHQCKTLLLKGALKLLDLSGTCKIIKYTLT